MEGRGERELLIALYHCLWVVAHEDFMNRDKKEVVYRKSIQRCQKNMLSQGTITKANGKFFMKERDLERETNLKTLQFIIMSMRDPKQCFPKQEGKATLGLSLLFVSWEEKDCHRVVLVR